MKKRIIAFALVLVLFVGLIPSVDADAAGYATGKEIVELAMTYIGKVPYVWGGTKIDGSNPGADCSGFICRLYEKFGFNFWANRTKLRNCGTNLGTDLSVAQLGDIIWYSGHVAIFAGWDNGKPMIVHCTGGNIQNVTYSRADKVSAELKGVIRIPGVTNNGEAVAKASFSPATQKDYVNKQFVGDYNACVVTQVTKLSGVKVSRMGLYLYDANGNLIKQHIENVSVGNSATLYHSWYDINEEVGVTLASGTTYKYQFFGIFDGQEIKGDIYSFTTTGQAPVFERTAYFYSGLDYSVCNTIPVYVGEKLGTLPEPYVPAGYAFKGWFTAKEGGSEVIPTGVFSANYDPSFYARYEKTVETAKAYLYSGLDHSWYNVIDLTAGQQIGIMPEAREVDGYVFDGWFTAKTDGQQVSPATIYNGGGDLYLYAHYKPVTKTYNARFHSGLDYEYCDTITVTYGQPIGTLPEPYVPKYYEFLGWYTAKEGGGRVGPNTLYDIESDYDIYARYEQVQFEPDFHRIMLWIGYPNMSIDGEIVPIDKEGTMPSIINGRTMLPIRAVIEAMGGSVAWDNSTKTVTLTKDGRELKLRIGTSYAWDSSNIYPLDSSPVIVNGRTLLPVRAVVEYFYGSVEWNNSEKCVTIEWEE